MFSLVEKKRTCTAQTRTPDQKCHFMIPCRKANMSFYRSKLVALLGTEQKIYACRLTLSCYAAYPFPYNNHILIIIQSDMPKTTKKMF